jgi:hypothetical protein
MITVVQRDFRVTYSLTEPSLSARPLPAMPTTTKSASRSRQKVVIILPGLMPPLPSIVVTLPSTWGHARGGSTPELSDESCQQAAKERERQCERTP